jgi:hypothetical protein
LKNGAAPDIAALKKSLSILTMSFLFTSKIIAFIGGVKAHLSPPKNVGRAETGTRRRRRKGETSVKSVKGVKGEENMKGVKGEGGERENNQK